MSRQATQPDLRRATPALPTELARLRRAGLWLLAALAPVLFSGCMHRRVTILSDPPGAVVLVDGEEIGTTPVGYDYTYYGTHHVTLIKDGYKTRTVPLALHTPWYQVFPLDFVTDNFALTKINDHRQVVYPLEPDLLMPTDDLRGRANALRSDALRSEGLLPGGYRP